MKPPTLFYSKNYCKHSTALLDFMIRFNLQDAIESVCVDRVKQVRTNGFTNIVAQMPNGSQREIPINVTETPSIWYITFENKIGTEVGLSACTSFLKRQFDINDQSLDFLSGNTPFSSEPLPADNIFAPGASFSEISGIGSPPYLGHDFASVVGGNNKGSGIEMSTEFSKSSRLKEDDMNAMLEKMKQDRQPPMF